MEEINKIEETSLVMPLKLATDPVDRLKTILISKDSNSLFSTKFHANAPITLTPSRCMDLQRFFQEASSSAIRIQEGLKVFQT